MAVEKGIVSLTGHVESYAAKTTVERIVKRVHGVTGVANDVEVKLASGSARDDIDIARSAVNALDWNVSAPLKMPSPISPASAVSPTTSTSPASPFTWRM